MRLLPISLPDSRSIEKRIRKLPRNLIAHRIFDEGHRHPCIESQSQSSVYFLLLPRALSTGYLAAFTCILSLAAASRSMFSLSAMRMR